MDPDLLREWRRWAAAEDDGRDDQADAACRAVFQTVPVRAPRPEFAGHVMEAVARAALRQTRVNRATAAGGGVLASVLGVAFVLQLPRLLRAGLDFSVNSVLWTIAAVDRGLNVWAILGEIGRTAAAIIAAPEVTFTLVLVALIAAGALYGLHRMLELEERSSL